jgi:hypothetical protein
MIKQEQERAQIAGGQAAGEKDSYGGNAKADLSLFEN